MREKEDYRFNLERLDKAFPNKEMLNITDIANYTGIDRRRILNTWGTQLKVIGSTKLMSKVALARLLS